MISTKGRYSIRILLDLAEHSGSDYVPMREVADRQGISLKYIERLMPALKAAGCNALRTAHNPPDTPLLDLCDELGLLVMDEAFDEWEGT